MALNFVPNKGDVIVASGTYGSYLKEGHKYEVKEISFNNPDKDKDLVSNISEMFVRSLTDKRESWQHPDRFRNEDDVALTVRGKDGKRKEIEVVRADVDQVILPEEMTIAQGINYLQAKRKEEEEVVTRNEEFDCHPFEGLLAFKNAFFERYGLTGAKPTPGFFGPTPPMSIKIQTGPNPEDFQEAMVGLIELPQWEGSASMQPCNSHVNPNGESIFVLHVSCKKRQLPEMNWIFSKIRELVKTQSLYKGKAIRLEFDEKPADLDHGAIPRQPEFMDVSGVEPAKLILPKGVESLVKTALFLPATHPNECRKQGIPLRRGTLLAGPYGTGKTLTAATLAKIGTEIGGTTFIYLKNVQFLAEALRFARRYAPAVVFSEDVDVLMGTDDRTDAVNEVLNIIDGVDTKQAEIQLVLTSNHAERLNKAMLRPGRIDTLIPFTPPDLEAAVRLLQAYSGDLKDKAVTLADLKTVAEILVGQIPAVFREVVERAKLAAIQRRLEKGIPTDNLTLFFDDYVDAAQSVIVQQQALSIRETRTLNVGEMLANHIADAVVAATTSKDGKFLPIVSEAVATVTAKKMN